MNLPSAMFLQAEGRFTILKHSMTLSVPGRGDHWDLLFENGLTLVTFEVEEFWRSTNTTAPSDLAPSSQSAHTQSAHTQSASTSWATRLPDHRHMYLDYEGPLSGNRGSVKQVTTGTYGVLLADQSQVRVRLSSQALHGTLELQSAGFDNANRPRRDDVAPGFECTWSPAPRS